MNNTENNKEEKKDIVLEPIITEVETVEETNEENSTQENEQEELKRKELEKQEEEKRKEEELQEAKRKQQEEEKKQEEKRLKELEEEREHKEEIRMLKERQEEEIKRKKEEDRLLKKKEQEEAKIKREAEARMIKQQEREAKRKEQEEIKRQKEEKKKQKQEERLEYKRKKAEIKQEKKLQDIKNHTSFFRILLILIVIVMAGYTYYSTSLYQRTVKTLKEECTPIKLYKKETKLDINSTLVKSLYKKVYTNMKEDYAQPEWNNTMKLYLAYRQIPENEKYDSNCNMFNPGRMEPYECDESKNFAPKAFHQNALILEYKKLFGENAEIRLDNIKLTNSCIGGYEYIKEREEFVEGKCTQQQTTNYKVTKTLKEAIGKRDTIVLVEEVMYKEGESMELPEYLRNGKYYYTFRLDMNYNFILISKKYEDEYKG